jgi:tyrosyl-tRNA synthetase
MHQTAIGHRSPNVRFLLYSILGPPFFVRFCRFDAAMQRSSYAPIARQLREAQWICRQCAAKHSRHASSVAVLSTQSSSRSRRQIFSSPSAQTNSAIVQQRRWIGRNYLKNIVAAEKDWQERSKQIENGDRKNILEVLEERGFVNQIVGSREQLQKLLQYRRVGVYCGVDPTAPSLHVGHMVPFMALSWMYIHGYPSTFLLGGATSRIGDPEGRLTAREQVGRQTRSANMALMHNQLKRFGPLMENYAKRRGYEREWAWRRALLNNAEWHSTLPWGTLIREMGQYVRLGPMLGRDSVKNRMTHGDGMSFAEFTYPLIQAWDWWEMFQKGVQIQIGGADQFGNILQGAEAVKSAAKNKVEWLEKVELEMKNTQELDKPDLSEEPMGFTVPLLTTANGEKFGKSAGNAMWLDASMTSVFELYAVSERSVSFWGPESDAF